jgi:hypothetical protein
MTITADPEKVAAWQAELDSALASHDDAEEVLVATKAKCDVACADAQSAVADKPSEENRSLEEVAHQAHKAEIQAAYAEFGRVAVAERNLKRARYGLDPEGSSNPATPGVVTPIEAHIEAASDVTS